MHPTREWEREKKGKKSYFLQIHSFHLELQHQCHRTSAFESFNFSTIYVTLHSFLFTPFCSRTLNNFPFRIVIAIIIMNLMRLQTDAGRIEIKSRLSLIKWRKWNASFHNSHRRQFQKMRYNQRHYFQQFSLNFTFFSLLSNDAMTNNKVHSFKSLKIMCSLTIIESHLHSQQ